MPKILVADDNSNIQKMVTLALKTEGIDVVAVGNGEAAVKKAIDINPDLVLADIFMPVRSGYEVCEFLKQDSRFSHIPVVLLAGAFDPFDEREAQRVGADGVLKKPFVPPDPLVALVKELLAKSGQLVGVSVPSQAPSPVQNSPVAATAPAASTGAPAPEASSPSAAAAQTFTPPAFVLPGPSSMAQEEVEDEINDTVVAPIRDFMIPSAADEPENGGAIPFASMLETTSLDSEIPAAAADAPEAESGPKPAGAHSAFEGFSPWRASPTDVATEVEEPADQSNQYMPSTKDLMGRVWEIDPSLAEKSPDETVIESNAALSPLTHSVAHTTSVRDNAVSAVETADVPQSGAAEDPGVLAPSAAASEPEPAADSRVSDWRSVFHRPPAAQEDQLHESSMSPWSQFTSTSGAEHGDDSAETPSNAEPETHGESDSSDALESRMISENDPSTYGGTPSIDYSDVPAEDTVSASAPTYEESAVSDTQSSVDREISADVPETAESESEALATDSSAPETADWVSALPQHLSPEDTTAIARSLVEGLAPAAVESMATSFPVPTGAPAEPQVVEDIVARVVERMQPQILEIITREVLRPVVEALVRRQLEQKSPE